MMSIPEMEAMMSMMTSTMMSTMMSFHLANLVNLLVAAAIAFLVGGIWYGPLFGKAWWAEQPHRKGSKFKGSSWGMVVQALHVIAVGVVVFALAHYTTAWCAFVMLGIMTSLGMISGGIFLGQSRNLVLITVGQHLLTLAIFALATTL